MFSNKINLTSFLRYKNHSLPPRVPMGPNGSQLVLTGSNGSQLVPTDPNWFQRVPTGHRHTHTSMFSVSRFFLIKTLKTQLKTIYLFFLYKVYYFFIINPCCFKFFSSQIRLRYLMTKTQLKSIYFSYSKYIIL